MGCLRQYNLCCVPSCSLKKSSAELKRILTNGQVSLCFGLSRIGSLLPHCPSSQTSFPLTGADPHWQYAPLLISFDSNCSHVTQHVSLLALHCAALGAGGLRVASVKQLLPCLSLVQKDTRSHSALTHPPPTHTHTHTVWLVCQGDN